MDAKILGLVQDFSFETGVMQNFLKLRLPDGTIINSAVDEQVALSAMRAFVEPAAPTVGIITEEQLAHSAKLAREHREHPAGNDASLFYFKDTNTEQPQDFSPVRLEDMVPGEFSAPPEETSEVMPVPHWSNGPAAKRHITANQAGYPVANGQDVGDPGELLGGGDIDEDGVGSL